MGVCSLASDSRQARALDAAEKASADFKVVFQLEKMLVPTLDEFDAQAVAPVRCPQKEHGHSQGLGVTSGPERR